MAARFWVGGTGTWDATTTANWSATSGGASGASVPGAADDVTIDSSFTVTTNYNVSVISVTINAATATLSLGGTLTCSGAITLTRGTFTTNNYAVSATALSSSNANTRTFNLGSSAVTLSAAAAIDFTSNTSITFNAGTSTITCSATSATIVGGQTSGIGVTFYNVSLTATNVSTHNINSRNTFNNLTVTAPAAAGVTQVTFNSYQTISGTLSTTGTAGNRRVWFRGVTYGLAQTLTINSAPSLTDADFRDIYVIGTSAPISGTRIGNLAGCSGITFDAAKTVYWNLAGAQNWSATGWATTSTGTPADNNFPLAQDTATFTNAGSVTGTITMDAAIPYTGTVDMSGRTSAMTLATTAFTIYGNWTNGSGTTLSGAVDLTFSGRNTQTITSNGKTFIQNIVCDSYGGTVQLADALSIGAQTVTITNGTFDTKNFNVSAGTISSSNSNVRTINLGSSTVTLVSSSPVFISTVTNLTFNAGTSQINCSSTSTISFSSGGLTFYNVSFTGTTAAIRAITGANTFNNLTLTASAVAGVMQCTFAANQTITGTLTVAGATAVRRIFVRSNTIGTARTLTVSTLSATDCDFRDITMAGAAAGSSPTRAGDCGGNTSITFPVAKTVYWNLAGAQNWSADGWATSSGGTPATNNFPLAQDTAVFDNTGSVTGTITQSPDYNMGTVDMSARTSAMTLLIDGNPFVYGNWKNGTGTTLSGSNTLSFGGRGTQTITSNGISFTVQIAINSSTGTVQLADAFTISSGIGFSSGTFDAVSYNVSAPQFNLTGATNTVKMGSGTWTLSGTGSVWTYSAGTLNKGTANIVLSDTSTTARTFAGGSQSYNKLTIGGTTGISTTSITGNNQFTELASTKTVAHTIDLGATTQTFGAWTVTGTVGNVVTVSGTATITIVGARVSGVDYLALGTTVISATSPGEFYAGANSTGGTNAILTAAPTATTRYWRGGTGTWDATTTTNWATTSGGAGPASVPTSADAVIFDTLSNATAYTVTLTATQLRCAALTMAGPAVGNVTFAGTAPLAIHGNTSLAATGITRSYTGDITLSGSSTGKTFTTNGVAIASTTIVNGVGCGWTLGSAYSNTSTFTVTNGSFNTGNYSFDVTQLISSNSNNRTIILGSSTVTISSSPITFTTSTNLTFTAGTSTINCSQNGPSFIGGDQTFYNVNFTSTNSTASTITGANTFNNFSITARTNVGINAVIFSANQTISGTLTLSAGTDAKYRTFLRSDTLGTTRTLTCAAFAGTDADFRDITISGAAAPVSGTRLGDCKGNSGITFGAGVTRYWNLVAGGNWSDTGWAATSGGSPAVNNFPLAQDTALFEATGLTSGNTVTVNAAYNIGTIDMSARTSNTMTLATGTTTPAIYGNWVNGTGTTLTGTGAMTFAGRVSQTITNAARTFTQSFTINTPSGSVTLQDAFVTNINAAGALTVTQGTFNAATYNVTLSGSVSTVSSSGTGTRTIAIGSGTWTLAGSGVAWSSATSTNLTVTGTGTISLTSTAAKTFAGGSISYSGITLNQGSSGTLTISGDNTFKDITNSYSATAATTINIGTTTQTVTQFTGTGTVGKVLTIQGTNASTPGTLILSSGTVTAPDYLAITGVRAYNLATTWYAGANSTNNGSLGWIFSAGASGTVLAGVLALGGLGTITATSSSVILPVTGIFAAGNVGTVTTSQEVTQALTNVLATGNVGTITPASGLFLTITGVLATGNVGTINTSQTLSRALTGNSASGAVGTVAYGLSLALTNNLATGSLGTITVSQALDRALTGNLATGFTGTIVTSQAFSRALTGNSASGAVGTVSYGRGYDISGVGASGAVGTMVNSQALTRVLTGVGASGIVGTIIPVSWQLINDSQNANWQLVNNAQTTTWQLINTPT